MSNPLFPAGRNLSNNLIPLHVITLYYKDCAAAEIYNAVVLSLPYVPCLVLDLLLLLMLHVMHMSSTFGV